MRLGVFSPTLSIRRTADEASMPRLSMRVVAFRPAQHGHLNDGVAASGDGRHELRHLRRSSPAPSAALQRHFLKSMNGILSRLRAPIFLKV